MGYALLMLPKDNPCEQAPRNIFLQYPHHSFFMMHRTSIKTFGEKMLRLIKIFPTSNSTTSKVSSSTHPHGFLSSETFFLKFKIGIWTLFQRTGRPMPTFELSVFCFGVLSSLAQAESSTALSY